MRWLLLTLMFAPAAWADATTSNTAPVLPINGGGTGATSLSDAEIVTSPASIIESMPGGMGFLFTFDRQQLLNSRSALEQVQTQYSAVGSLSIAGLNATTKRAVVVTRPNGGYLSFDGIANTTACVQISAATDAAVAAMNAAPQQFELMLLLRQQGIKYGVILNNGTTTTDHGFSIDSGIAANGQYTFDSWNGAARIGTAELTMPAGLTRALRRRWHVISVHADGTNITFETVAIAGSATTVTTSTAIAHTGAGTPDHTLTLSNTYDSCASGIAFDLQVAGIGQWSRPLTSAERTAAATDLFKLADLPSATDLEPVTVFGDSTMQGGTTASSPTVWMTLSALLPQARVNSRATGGATISQIVTQVTDELANDETPRVAVFQAGVNDMSGGCNANTLYTSWTAGVTALKNAGVKTVCTDITPNGNDATCTAAMNALILANTAGCDTVVDTYALGHDTSGGTQTWRPPYNADSTHPNAIGNRMIGAALAQAVKPYL